MAKTVSVLYVSYNGLLEPILPSQAVPYFTGLSQKGYVITCLTFEKKEALRKIGADGVRRMRDELALKGVKWRHLVYHKWPRLIATLYDLCIGAFYCLYLIVSQKVKIVHVRGITPGSMILFLAKSIRVKILFDMRGLLAEEIAAGGGWVEGSASFNLVKKCEKALLQRADAVSVLTHKHLEMNRGLDVLKGRTIPMDVIPCCVDLGKFDYDSARGQAFRRELGVDAMFVLMYQGKIGSFYCMDQMVDLFKVLLGLREDSIFMIISNDPIDGVIERVAADGIDVKRVRQVKGVDFDGMPRYLEIADAGIFFINPHNKLGSSPIKMGEFLASGIPVVINSGIGDTEELVRDNKVGVVARDLNTDSYRTALEELFALIREGDALRQRCRQTARASLLLEDGIERYAALYEKLLGPPR